MQRFAEGDRPQRAAFLFENDVRLLGPPLYLTGNRSEDHAVRQLGLGLPGM